MIALPPMTPAQEAAWHALLDLHERHPQGWTLIGGQLVHLHCAERGYAPQRATEDADALVNAREPDILGAVTTSLLDLGFEPTPSADGVQHRWRNGSAVLDVLIPEGVGKRVAKRPSASGFPTISAPGGTQALARSEAVEVSVAGRQGHVNRPVLLSAMIIKAAARLETTGPGRDRHCYDFAALGACLAAVDMAAFELTKKDRTRLRSMVATTVETVGALETHPAAVRRLNRLVTALETPGDATGRLDRPDALRRTSGSHTGRYEPGYLEDLRAEWPD